MQSASNIFKFFSITLLIANGVFSANALAATYTAVSSGGDTLSLEFQDDVVTTSSTEATFCNARRLLVVSADLWMPSMGHGSSPVSLYPQANGCTVIRNMNFMMPGDWQVRIRMQNNDTGKIALTVQEAR
jgi:hypothetical protein